MIWQANSVLILGKCSVIHVGSGLKQEFIMQGDWTVLNLLGHTTLLPNDHENVNIWQMDSSPKNLLDCTLCRHYFKFITRCNLIIINYLCLGSVHVQPCQTRKVSGWDGWSIHFCNHTVCVCWITNHQHLWQTNNQHKQLLIWICYWPTDPKMYTGQNWPSGSMHGPNTIITMHFWWNMYRKDSCISHTRV